MQCAACFIETPVLNDDEYCVVCEHNAAAFDLLVDEAKLRLQDWVKARRLDDSVELTEVATVAVEQLLEEVEA